ncbi:MAG: hypothetical protein ACP5RP_04510 [Candidatus Micrarchaeia archaeon]
MEASKNKSTDIRKLIREAEEVSKKYLIIPAAVVATVVSFGADGNASAINQQAQQPVAVHQNLEENVNLNAEGTAIFIAALGAAASAEAFAIIHGIDTAMKQAKKKKGGNKGNEEKGN